MVNRETESKENTRTVRKMNQVQSQRLTELNIELVTCVTRTLRSVDDFCEKHHISIPDDPKIEYLVGQVLSLIYEINGKTPTNLELTEGITNREDTL
jgi:hypothetical protein